MYVCILCIQRHDLTCMLYVHVFTSVCIMWLPRLTPTSPVAVCVQLGYIEQDVLQSKRQGTICFEILFYFSKGDSRVVCANHGPRVDVVQGAAWTGLATPIALASHHEDASAYFPSSCPPPGPCILLMNSSSSSLASRYWRIHAHTFNTDTYIHWPTWENQLVMTWARSLRKSFPPRKSDWNIWRECILTNTYTYIQYMHIHTYSN